MERKDKKGYTAIGKMLRRLPVAIMFVAITLVFSFIPAVSADALEEVATVTFIGRGRGPEGPATIDKGSGPELLQVGEVIEIGDVIETNSDRVQYNDICDGITRMSAGSVVEMMAARPEIEHMYPGLTFSPWFHEGEVLRKGGRRGGGDGKYRTSCYICHMNAYSVVFLQPGSSPTQDRYFALTEYTSIWDDHMGNWALLFELNPSEKGTLETIGGVYQLPALIEPISPDELDYITVNYLDASLWSEEVPAITPLSLLLALLSLFGLGAIAMRKMYKR